MWYVVGYQNYVPFEDGPYESREDATKAGNYHFFRLADLTWNVVDEEGYEAFLWDVEND